MLKAIESLGQALGMTIIAEGVETYEEVAYLQAATQIRYAQGYYYAKPMLIEQMLLGGGRIGQVHDRTPQNPAPRPPHRAARSG